MENIQHVAFQVWALSFSKMNLRRIHVISWNCSQFLFYHCMVFRFMNVTQFVYLIISWMIPSCFQFLTTRNKYSFVGLFFCGPYGWYMIKFTRNHYSAFQNDWIILHCHQWCMRVPTTLHVNTWYSHLLKKFRSLGM